MTMTAFFTALVTLCVTVLAGVVLDFIRNGRPKIVYSAKEAVPIKLEDGKSIGAYIVSIKNTSKRVVKDVECYMDALPAKLRNGGVSAPQGIQFSLIEEEHKLRFTAPYLHRNDRITITVVADGRYVPKNLDVAVRSPNDLKIVKDEEATERGIFRGNSPYTFALAGIIASVISAIAATGTLPFLVMEDSPQDVLTSAAAISNLPHLTEVYATHSPLHFYNQADLVCALATSVSDRAEIDKYRKFLSVTLSRAGNMWATSRANLYYCRAKLDLQLSDSSSAIQDFRQAIDNKASLVHDRAKSEPAVRDFLNANSIH